MNDNFYTPMNSSPTWRLYLGEGIALLFMALSGIVMLPLMLPLAVISILLGD